MNYAPAMWLYPVAMPGPELRVVEAPETQSSRHEYELGT